MCLMADILPPSGRSYLYVPGDRQVVLERATTRDSDALILDLEDAVPPGRKDAARTTVARWLRDQAAPRQELWVRINSTSPELDIAAAATKVITGVVVSKAQPDLLSEVDRLLTTREQELGLTRGSFAILALIETAAGLVSVLDVARAARVQRLGFGEADLAADLRLIPTESREELTSLRLKLVIASAAAGIAPPVGPASTDYRDLAALRNSTELLLRLGYRGRTAIHPAQLKVINEVFTPTAVEVGQARQLIISFEEAQRNGTGVLTDGSGLMVDIAVIKSAREIVARALHAE